MNYFKSFALLISFIYSASAIAQDTTSTLPMNPETKLISYSKVVPLDSVSKSELYKRALIWVNTFYKNPGDAVREKDSAAGKIVCMHRIAITDPPDKKDGFKKDAGRVQYTLTIQFRENRYKYDLTQINWKQLSYYPIERWMDTKASGYTEEYAYYLKETDESIKKILADLEKAMTVNSVKVVKDDW